MEKEQVIKRLEAAGFMATYLEEEGRASEAWRVQHETFENFLVYAEFKGDLLIVDGDIYYDLFHGNVAAWTLLATVLPQQSILIQCGDVSHLVNRHTHPEGWADVTEGNIRRFYPSQFNRWLYQDVSEFVEEWLAERDEAG